MPRKKQMVPKFRVHKARGYAFVRLNGSDVYLGKRDDEASRGKYEQVVAEWLRNGRKVPEDESQVGIAGDGITVAELILEYVVRYATPRYRKDGKPTNQLKIVKLALKPLRQLYGDRFADQFGPRALEHIRDHMVESGTLSRGEINRRIGIIKRAFRWGTAQELLATGVWQRLAAVENLERGRTEVPDPDPVTPVAWPEVEACLRHLPPPVAAMVQLQWFSGMRPGEVRTMTTGAIDRSGKVWEYRPATHKMAHRGRKRVIPLGPKCQEILRPYLKLDPKFYLFSPAEAEAERQKKRSAERKSKVPPSQRKRAAQRRKSSKRRFAACYSRYSYGTSDQACEHPLGPPEKQPLRSRPQTGPSRPCPT